MQGTMPKFPAVDQCEFRHLPDWPGYAVSSDGYIWSCKRRHGRRRGFGVQWTKLKATWGSGYLRVHLRRAGRQWNVCVHVLVLTVFRGPRPIGKVACHFPDRDRRNNRASNLLWGTYADNSRHRDIDGQTQRGRCHYRAKLTDDDVRAIRAMRANGFRMKAIAKRFGVTHTNISEIVRRKTWKHV